MQVMIKRGIIAVVVLGVVGGGIALAQKNGKSKKDEITYESEPAVMGDVKSFVTATGTIQPWKIVDVKSDIAGRLIRFGPADPRNPSGPRIDLGSTVRQGQLIAEIDPTDTRTALNQARADLEAATAKTEQAEFGVTYQEIQTKARILSARKAVVSAQAKLAQARFNMTAQPKLTASQINQARASLASAGKSVLQAQKTKAQLQEQLLQLKQVTIPLNVETIESTVQQAKANMDTAEKDYSRQRTLMGQGYVAKADVEASYARMATTQANHRQALQRKKTLEQEHQSTVRELESKVQSAQDSIEEAQARVDQATASLELAQTNQFQDEVRKQEVEAAKATVDQANAELDSAEADSKQILMKGKDVLSAKAQVVRSEASLDQARTNAGYTRIIAPRDGVVLVKSVEEGTVIPSSRGSIGSTNALLQIGDVSRLWVVCNVDETDIGQVSVNQKVTVKVDAYPSLLVEGKVIRIDPQAKIDQNVTLIPVTVQLDEPDERFKPGMNATCEFIVAEVLDVLTVPNEAVKEKGEGEFFVQKMTKAVPPATKDKIEDVPITVGLAGPDTTEIQTGLKVDELVVTKTITPEKTEAQNPFNPFGGFGGRGGGRGGPGGGRGGTGGGGTGGGGRGGGR